MRPRISVGRQRAGGNITPFESGYLRDVQSQMNQIMKNMEAVVNSVEGATPNALLKSLRPIFDESQVLVPKKTGRLKMSGFLKAIRTSTGASAAIGYAAAGDPHYAAHVHERLDIQHASPTQAKFLEQPAIKHLPRLRGYIVDAMRKETGITP